MGFVGIFFGGGGLIVVPIRSSPSSPRLRFSSLLFFVHVCPSGPCKTLQFAHLLLNSCPNFHIFR